MNNVAQLRLPPHSIDAEQALIGAVLHKPDVLLEFDLQADAFYRREHRALWTALMSLHEARKPIDAVSLADALDAGATLEDAGGIDYLGSLVTNFHSAANAVHYAAIVRGKAQERRLASKGQALADIAYSDGTTADKLAQAQALMADLECTDSSEGPRQISSALKNSVMKLEYRHDHKGQLHGLPTGFIDLDNHLLGLVDGDLIVVAGRPSMGKTTLAINIAEHIAMQGHLVIVFSLEMPEQKLTDRMICSLAKVDAKRYRKGEIHEDEWQRIDHAVSSLKDKHCYIDDSSTLTSTQILSRARRIARKLGMKPALVVVDYLQILRDKGEGVERVTRISANLKQAARELSCPVIALSQLSRAVENRSVNDRRPLMADLRESGAIEQDADVILMVYRDEVYSADSEHKGTAEIIVRKNRDGELGTIHLNAPLHRNRFETLTPGWRPITLAAKPGKAMWSAYRDD